MKRIAYIITSLVVAITIVLGFIDDHFLVGAIGAFMFTIYWLKKELDLRQKGKGKGTWEEYFACQWDDYNIVFVSSHALIGLQLWTLNSTNFSFYGLEGYPASFILGFFASVIIDHAYSRRDEIVDDIIDKKIKKS